MGVSTRVVLTEGENTPRAFSTTGFEAIFDEEDEEDKGEEDDDDDDDDDEGVGGGISVVALIALKRLSATAPFDGNVSPILGTS